MKVRADRKPGVIRWLAPDCPGHQAKIGELYRRTAVGHRDVFRLEINDWLVLLVVNHQIERDFVGVGDESWFYQSSVPVRVAAAWA